MSYILWKSEKKANCIFAHYSYISLMKIINISNTNIRINENCYLYDDGAVEHVDIVISAGVQVEYCFIETPENLPKKYSRHIAISQDSVFTGTGVIMDSVDFNITTEII